MQLTEKRAENYISGNISNARNVTNNSITSENLMSEKISSRY